METQFIHNLTFDGDRCRLHMADKPAGDPSAKPLPEVVHTRKALQTQLKVCSLSMPQQVTTDGVFFHPDVYSAVSDWLIDT